MAKRLGKLQAFLREQKLDALLIKSKTMKKYMDTLTGSGCQILLMRDQGYLIVDGRYLIEANEREHDLQIVQHMPHTGGNGYLGVVEELLHKHACTSMGVESSQQLVKEYWRMEALGVDILSLIHIFLKKFRYLLENTKEEYIITVRKIIKSAEDTLEVKMCIRDSTKGGATLYETADETASSNLWHRARSCLLYTSRCV